MIQYETGEPLISKNASIVGIIIASFLCGFFAWAMLSQFLSLALGDGHAGGLYGNRGNALMYEDY